MNPKACPMNPDGCPIHPFNTPAVVEGLLLYLHELKHARFASLWPRIEYTSMRCPLRSPNATTTGDIRIQSSDLEKVSDEPRFYSTLFH